MENVTAWDTERFSEVRAALVRAARCAYEQYTAVSRLRTETQEGWKSRAGQEYAERVGEDLQRLAELVRYVTELVEEVDSVKGLYETYEQRLNVQLTRLLG